MYFMKRALLYVRRKKSKVALLLGILFVASTLILTGLVIESASKKTFEYARNELGGSVVYTTDLSGIERVPGMGMRDSVPTDFTNISLEEVEMITSSTSLLESYSINATIAVNPIDFSYFSVEEVNDDRKMPASLNIIGASDEENDNIFFDGSNKIIDGRYFTDDEINGSNVIIIEETIAKLNNFSVSDKISVSKFNRGEEGTIIEFEIIGIYKTGTPTDISAEDFRGSFNLNENKMYVPFNTVLKYNESRIDSVVFNLANPEDVEEFSAYVDSFPINYRTTSANDEAYQKMVGPILSVSKTSSLLVLVVILAGAFIIFLLSALSIKDRKYELGVLLSLGESRFKIIMQLIFESVLISIVAFSFSIVVSQFSAQYTTNFLLNNTSVEEVNEEPAFGMGRFRINNFTAVDVDVIDSLSVDVNLNE